MAQAGRLTEKLTLQRKSITLNDAGEDVVTWADQGIYWGNVRPLTGREMGQAGQTWAVTQFELETRHRPDIDPRRADRLAWGSRYLDVLNVEDSAIQKGMLRWIAQEFVE